MTKAARTLEDEHCAEREGDARADRERETRAARVRVMLDRWTQEDVSSEPHWDVRDLAPLRLRAPAGARARVRGTRRTAT